MRQIYIWTSQKNISQYFMSIDMKYKNGGNTIQIPKGKKLNYNEEFPF
ncbi:hypothetical protein [Aquimarina algiphila]|nr:hypothetical protein [Aquimarina algiphila]